MASPESDSTLSLAQHIPGLYPLARVLAGPEEAVSLVERVYEHAAEVPPPHRPDDDRRWLVRLMIEAQGSPHQVADPDERTGTETSFTDDPFRQTIAEETAERMLPVAYAACSRHERFILAIDVLATPSDEELAQILDVADEKARSIRDGARSALRASLRDVLNGPERMLVDVALPDEELRDRLRSLLSDRFQSPPASLHSTVTETLESARAKWENRRSSDDTTVSNQSFIERVRSSVQNLISIRGLVGVGLFAVLMIAGAGGVSYFLSSSSTSSTSVVDLSALHVQDVEIVDVTTSRSEADQYIRRTWNRRISIPTISGTSLQGVGHLALANDADVPALLYADDESNEQIVAYAFNYALVDELGKQASIERPLRQKLAANDTILARRHGDRAVALWRQRDDIMILVSQTLDADALRSRVRL